MFYDRCSMPMNESCRTFALKMCPTTQTHVLFAGLGSLTRTIDVLHNSCKFLTFLVHEHTTYLPMLFDSDNR